MNPPRGPLRFSERLLLLLSRKPESTDHAAGHDHWTVDNALEKLCASFAGFTGLIGGKDILDYGCGEGFQSVAMAKCGARRVVGVEINGAYRERASRLAAYIGVGDRVQFAERCDESAKAKFDVVLSHNSMEHFRKPEKALDEMSAALKPNGKLLVAFEPPWFAPYGSHMHFFTRVPWVNILFCERTVMNVRKHFINDGASRYEDVEGGLNRMTVASFERLVARSGLQVAYRRYTCVKGFNFLASVPWIRELSINKVDAVLAWPAGEGRFASNPVRGGSEEA
jgi:SAM-dependent methyltransferase